MNTELKKTLFQDAALLAEETMNYKVEENMPKMEVLRVASTLFQADWIKLEYTQLMMSYEHDYVHPDIKKVILLIKKIIIHSRTLEVPSVGTRAELETLIESMGIQIYEYLKCVWFKLDKFDTTTYKNALTIYLNNFIWRNNGRLHYEMMVNEMWEKKTFPSEFTKFFELSVHSFEDKLKKWYAEVEKKTVDDIHRVIQQRCKFITSKDVLTMYEYDYYLLAYWHYRLVYGVELAPIDDLIAVYKRTFDHAVVEEDGISEGNMLALCAYYGHYVSLEYFWNRMSNEERNRFFIKTLVHTFDDSDKIKLEFYGTKTEVLEFFMKKMNAENWEKFLENVYHGEVPIILIAVLMTIPFRVFYFPTMDIMEKYIPKIFKGLLTFLKRDHELMRQEKEIKELIPKILRVAGYEM